MSCVLIAFVYAHPLFSFAWIEPKPPDFGAKRWSCRDDNYRERVEKHLRQLQQELKQFETFCEITERVKFYWRKRTRRSYGFPYLDLWLPVPTLFRSRHYLDHVPQYFPPDPAFPLQRERDSMLDPTGELRREKK